MTLEKNSRPLVILGLDTGDHESIAKWVEEGHLPTIASIMQRGCHGTIGGPEMICEYGVSLSLFSGVSRSRHGYYFHRQLKPGTYELHHLTPGEINWPVFWSELNKNGGNKRVLAVDVPDVTPVKGLPGVQVADWGAHHGSENPPTAEPPEALDAVKNIFGERLLVQLKPDAAPSQARIAREQLLERVRRKGELARGLMDEGPFDLMAYFFSDSDLASHLFWKYRPEARDREEASKAPDLEHGVRDLYQAIDREFASILEKVPEDANVVVLSLYGIRSEYPTSTLTETFCKKLGYHAPAGGDENKTNSKNPAGKKFKLDPVSIARKLMPQWLRAAISKRLPRAAQERLLSSMLRDNTNWSKTRAFAIPSISMGFIRVNLKGREPQGCVEPGEAYEQVLSEIEADLKQITDPKNGERAVRRTVRTVDLFGGDPPDRLPDLFVEWEPRDYFVDRVDHPKATLIQEPPGHFYDSQEKMEGFFAAAGPDIHGKGNLGDVPTLDVAPTLLHLLGEPKLSQMDGEVIKCMVEAETTAAC